MMVKNIAPPDPVKVRIETRLTGMEAELVRRLSSQSGVSRANLLRQAVQELLRKEGLLR